MDQIPNTPQMKENEKARSDRRKRKIIKGILIFSAIVVVLSFLFSLIDPDKLVESMFADKQQDAQEEREIDFYPRDDEEDIFQNEGYAQYDRRLFIHDASMGATYSIEEADLATSEDDIVFFYNYFDIVIRGDDDGYRTLFSKAYLADNELPEDFTMQMLYDITVTPLGDRLEDLSYKVEYKIYRNNGSFRNDLESDASIPLCFVLVSEDGVLKIDSIRKYTSYGR